MLENEFKINLSNELSSGFAFPFTVSKNNVVGHATCKINDNFNITKDGIYKFDLGTHCNGFIIDSAFSITFDRNLQPLIDAVTDALNESLKIAGVDTYLYEISDTIEEIIDSYEITIDGKTTRLHPARKLGGHLMCRFSVHGDGETIIWNGTNNDPLYKQKRMKVDTCYAIEPIATSGDPDYDLIQQFMVLTPEYEKRLEEHGFKDNYMYEPVTTVSYREYQNMDSTCKQLYNLIQSNYNKLPFAPRWLYNMTGIDYTDKLNVLSKQNILFRYYPLMCEDDAYTSHMEHTLFVKENGIEVFSKGDDY